MTPAERELALQNLADSRERLLRMAHGLSREQLHFRPAPDRWSVAECLEHIVTVEARLLERIQTTLEKGPDSSRRSAFEGKDAAMVTGTIARELRFQAPEILVPTGRVARRAAIAGIRSGAPEVARLRRQHPGRFAQPLLQAPGPRRPRPLSMAAHDRSPLRPPPRANRRSNRQRRIPARQTSERPRVEFLPSGPERDLDGPWRLPDASCATKKASPARARSVQSTASGGPR